MTKEEMKAELKDLLDWATNGYIALNPISEDYKRYEKEFNDLIDQHFDNPPLSFDDLEVGEAYWDNLRECWFIVTEYDPTAYYQEKEICWYFG